jgi:predicted amidohydrolase
MPSRVARTAADRREAWAIISGNIERGLMLIDRSVAAEQPPPRLVLLPEFAFQGPPRGESVDEWIGKACYSVPGEITAPFQAKAAELGIYIGGNQFEADPEWPHRHFNTSWLIDPAGDVILRYRRIHTAQWVSPHDLLDAYLDRYGVDGLYPVAETELGRIGMLACGEILVPESARVLMLRGAEVLLHPTNEPYSEAEEAAKIVAAAAHMMYVVSANVAGPIGFSDGEPMNDPVKGTPVQGGHSRIVSYKGETSPWRTRYSGPASRSSGRSTTAPSSGRRTSSWPSPWPTSRRPNGSRKQRSATSSGSAWPSRRAAPALAHDGNRAHRRAAHRR